MTTPARVATKPSPLQITPADERVLLALNRYHHLSAEQVRRLLYGRGSLKYAYERLKRLVDAGFVSHDQARGMVGVYALDGKGRSYLAALGFDVLPRWRPAEEQEPRRLLLRPRPGGRRRPDRRRTPRTGAPGDRARGDLPRPGAQAPLPAPVRLARTARPAASSPTAGSISASRWPMAASASPWCSRSIGAPTSDAAGSRRPRRSSVSPAGRTRRPTGRPPSSIAVVATPGEARRAELTAWTEALLRALRVEDEADLFRLTGADPIADPFGFFCGPVWYRPFDRTPLPLLEPREGGA